MHNMRKILIKNCHECPLANNDNERGRDECNLKDIKLDSKNWEQLPEDTVHNECPLKKDDHLIMVTSELLIT